MGKLSEEELDVLLSRIKKTPKVVVPPTRGYDSGVHLIGDKYLVVSTDPCIGVPDNWFGWLLINYAASDVALFGADPEFCTLNLLGPVSLESEVFQNVMEQASCAAEELNISIVAGHTGRYQGVSELIGVCTAYGMIGKEKLITPGNAAPNNCIMCAKTIGSEVAANFSFTNRALANTLFGSKRVKELSKSFYLQSCVKEAKLFSRTGIVNAMHDVTEGGLVGALNEMAKASKIGFEIELEKVPIGREIQILREHFRLSEKQVLSMSSTGTVLAAVEPQAKKKIEEVSRQNGLPISFIGKFTKNQNRILVAEGRKTPWPRFPEDPYRRILSGQV